MNKVLIILIFLTISATLLLFANKPILPKPIVLKAIDSLCVSKSKGLLYVYHKHQLLKTYVCGIGQNTNGHKQQQGDNRTPEGLYYLTNKTDKSSYYKNFHISYPNATDKARCKKAGVPTGGDVKLHGYATSNGSVANRTSFFAYTWGCVAVCNADMDELYKWVTVGAPIYIVK
jgi:murein L,D-transpeptidase YafK